MQRNEETRSVSAPRDEAAGTPAAPEGGVHADLTSLVLSGLNPPQREAVCHDGGPALVLAGAGSGKTRVLTRRVAWLIGVKRVPPGAILAVTFTNKAAGEMKERIISLVGDVGRNAWVGTFHAMGARIVRREAERVGVTRDFSIFDRADQLAAIKRVLNQMGISPKEYGPESLLATISRAKNELVSPEQYTEAARGPYERLVASVYENYRNALRGQNALDFDDLLYHPVQLLRDESTRQRYARLFTHVLVDEYQDTNRCQYEFLHAVARDHRQLFVVGDDDQSIYRWRGADLKNILDFESDFPDARVVRLEQNYRSTQRILAAANSVIRKNIGRKGKELWTENDEGDCVLVLEVADEQAEAMAVLQMVKEGIEQEGRAPDDFVVLYRTNAQSRVLENTFQLGGVAYQVVGGQRFYERREIKDVLAYLRVLVNPGDNVALRRILNVPVRGIGKKSLEDLEAAAQVAGVSLLEVIRRTAAGAGEGAAVRSGVQKKLAEFAGLLERAAAELETRPVAAITEEIIEEIGYQQHLEKEAELQAVARWENVVELLTAMQEFADSPDREDASVAAFLQEVSLVSEVDEYEEDVARVTLMTLHCAKGLEFPWVFITGLEDGLFPHANSLYEEAGLEEERRLFYVGLTRGQERVTLLTAAERRRYGAPSAAIPSRFLEEIDDEFILRRSLSGRPAAGARPRGVRRTLGPRRAGRPGPEDVPDAIPNYEDESQEAATVTPGLRVRHPSWGEGVIETVEGRGQNLKLTIRFRGGVRKKVLAIYAKLELLG